MSSNGREILGLIFNTIDTDRSGSIDWKEFLKAMSTLEMGRNEDKIDLYFKLYDPESSGKLSFDNVKHLMRVRIFADITNLDEYIDSVSEYFASEAYRLADVCKSNCIS